MLRINRIKIMIDTDGGEYGFDEKFTAGLNFIASYNNTCGKSSIISGIYYCLGFEEIIGGQGEKILTAAYKSDLKDGKDIYNVLQSKLMIEISNGEDIITVYRTAKMENRKSKLITVFYSEMDKIEEKQTEYEDMYVHSRNSAVNEKGFHSFLEKFLNLSLPIVPTSDDDNRKLYLQLLFSGIFIEQKRGWADLFSAMPYLGIKESKKRIVEYIIGLETVSNERKKNELSKVENEIRREWKKVISDMFAETTRAGCNLRGVPLEPEILEKNFERGIHVLKDTDQFLDEYINALKNEYCQLTAVTPKIIDNYDKIEFELEETEKCIDSLREEQSEARRELMHENLAIQKLQNELETIKADIVNNVDAKKLQDLGSTIGSEVLQGVCPVCHQRIQDTLLPQQNMYAYMSIEENIKHLNAQKDMYDFAIKGHKQKKKELDDLIETLMGKTNTLCRLAKTLRSDINSVDENISESVVYKKFELDKEIQDLEDYNLFITNQMGKLDKLSERWKEYLVEKEKLPKSRFTKNDTDKLSELRDNFVRNLREYSYTSVSSLDKIEISKDTYLPVVENFDMKFESSASDNIRAIWAFTMALMQTSMEKGGNHVNMLIFDEPDQHSIVMKDLQKFFDSIIALKEKSQVILGITVRDKDTEVAISKLKKDDYHMIHIGEKAFVKKNEVFRI